MSVLTRATFAVAFLAAGYSLYLRICLDGAPSVQIGQGLVKGKIVLVEPIPDALDSKVSFDQEHFLGIPFALPPLGGLRFGPPLPLPDDSNRVIEAKEYGKACIQPINRVATYYNPRRDDVSEDCLTLNILRPRGSFSHQLPVMVWIYGGAFVTGASKIYDGTDIIAKSVAINKPIIYVSLNYRLNLFGFLASEEVAKASKERNDVVLNAGLHDQRFALEWIQRNIGAFGGDKDQVTVFGESAGAISVGAHLLAEHWISRHLFRAAILQSGAASGYPIVHPSKFQSHYVNFSKRVGCGSDVDQSTDDAPFKTLHCLRTVPTDVLLDASMAVQQEWTLDRLAIGQVPYGVAQDDDFYHGRPSVSLKAGNIATLPIISGTNLDEGTTFSPFRLESEKDLRYLVENAWVLDPSPNVPRVIDTLLKFYPDDPTVGSPYVDDLGLTDLDPNDRLFEPPETNQFKRMSALFGDLVFEGGRRAQLKAHLASSARLLNTDNVNLKVNGEAKKVPIWSYHFRQPEEGVGRPKYLGVSHGSEVSYVFGQGSRAQRERSDIAEVSHTMMHAWIQFAHTLDPNGPDLPSWPKYTASSKETLQIRARNMTSIRDDYREDAIDFIALDEEWNSVTSR